MLSAKSPSVEKLPLAAVDKDLSYCIASIAFFMELDRIYYVCRVRALLKKKALRIASNLRE
jgi:hypothetical protein